MRNIPQELEGEVEEQIRIYNEIRQYNTKNLKDRNKVRINTNYQKNEIECIEEYP